MDPSDRQLLLDIHGKVSALDHVPAALGAIDSRLRDMEIKHGEHEVKISRAQEDLEGLGRKLRYVADRERLERAAGDLGRGRGRNYWIAFLEFLAAIPAFWHVLISVGTAVTMALVILWRHWPK